MTDGSVAFGSDPVMLAVQRAIEAENQQVTAGGRYESVVLLDPFTFQPGGTVSQQRMDDELMGGYLAQRAVNQEPGGIPVQLLLANEGTSAQEFAGQAVRQIESREAADRIVAVAGMGLSVTSTQAAATALSADGMAMFGAVTTGDQLNGNNYPGFFQIVPDVGAQVHELSGYLDGQLPGLGSGQFVALVSDAAATDVYSVNLLDDFQSAFDSQTPVQQYSFRPDASGATSQYATITGAVCGQPGPVKGAKPNPYVLYAGRAAALPDLIQQFQQSASCAGETVTIVTGSDANGLPASSAGGIPSGPSAVKTGVLASAGGNSRAVDLSGATGPGAAGRLSFTKAGQLESAAIPVDRFAGGLGAVRVWPSPPSAAASSPACAPTG